MKHLFLLSFIFITFSQLTFSQDLTAFAITGHGNGDFNWSDIRGIDMTSGNVSSVLFENGKTGFSFLNAETGLQVDKQTLTRPEVDQKLNEPVFNKAIAPSPMVLMSAAIAYDQKHGKIFFASMHTGKLMWLDTRSRSAVPAFYTIDQSLVNSANSNDEAFNITRMTIGANGNGYAITNDANHLISFSTGGKTVITDLGNIVDAESNKSISIHNRCTSWGGDVVADAFGKLVLFTAAHQVFEIDINTRIATFKGAVLNLPPTFSLNGAAVDNEGNVIISSANTFDGFYKIDMKNLSATKLPTTGKVFNASDLASSFLLNQKEATMSAATLPQPEVIGNRLISIYPNPVSDGQIKVSFDKQVAGEYKVELRDLEGRLIDYKKIYIKSRGQLENFKFHSKPVKGLYLIKVTDTENRDVFSDKLLIE